jgi:hypothetical protein
VVSKVSSPPSVDQSFEHAGLKPGSGCSTAYSELLFEQQTEEVIRESALHCFRFQGSAKVILELRVESLFG